MFFINSLTFCTICYNVIKVCLPFSSSVWSGLISQAASGCLGLKKKKKEKSLQLADKWWNINID